MSSRKCAVLRCPNKYIKVRQDLSYFGLPSNVSVKGKWLEWIAAQNNCSVESLLSVNKSIYVCSKHFKDSCKGARKLITGAIPSEVFPEILESCNNINIKEVESVSNNIKVDPDIVKCDQHEYSSVVEVKLATGEVSLSHVRGDFEAKSSEHYSSVVEVSLKSEVDHDVVNSRSQYSSVVEVEVESGVVSLSRFGEDESALQFPPIVEVSLKSSEVHSSILPQQCSIIEVGVNPNAVEELPATLFQSLSCDSSEGTFLDGSALNSIEFSNIEKIGENVLGVLKCEESCNLLSVEEMFCDQDNAAVELFDNSDMPDNDQPICQENANLENVKKFSKSKKKKKCSGCDSPEGSFFAYPAIKNVSNQNDDDTKRCKVWVCKTGNMDLLKKLSKDLHRQNFLCAKHFEDNQFTNRMKNRLMPKAEPSKNFDREPLPDFLMTNFPIKDNVETVMFETENEADLDTAEKLDIYQKIFNEVMFSFEWKICEKCNVKFYKKKDSKQTCVYTKKICEKFSELHIDEVPDELKDLTFIEEQLIAKVHPIVSVIKLKNHQLGYQGHVINFPQDVKGFASQLPPKLNELSSVLTVRVSGNLKPVDFQVRAAKVRNALIWLKNNNKFYYDVEIAEDNLNMLPEDGNVFELLNGILVNEENIEPETSNIPDENGKELEEDIYESNSPIMSKATASDQVESVLSWPTISSQPINEFKDESYILQAFPCLFPKGNGIMNRGRNQIASSLNYFKHLMRFKDSRFAQHNRFRYFALNSYMRWCALKNGNLFVRTQPEFENMKLDQLKQELKNNPSLIKKLMYRNSSISGSKSYWFARGKELLSMVEQIGLPTLFCTLSAADLHWPDLFKLLSPEEDFENMSIYRRKQLVKLNPMVVDSFFLKRAEVFMEEVLVKKYNVKDHWFRIEYQHRGSPHLHGVLWLEGAPDVTDILKKTQEEQQVIVDYFSNLVTAFHPNIGQIPSDVHPCQKKLLDIEDLDADLAEIINKVQRHTVCSKQYCIRKNKKKQQMQCRFKFPQDYQDEARININENGNAEFLPKRNDDRLNKYNRYILQTWRANIDVAPVISKTALINYLAKYISKSEKRSDHFADLMHIINETTDEHKTAKSIVQRMYIKACAERDFSAQETCHLLMGSKLYSSGGRNFVSINFNDTNEWRLLRNDDKATSLIEKYQSRSGDLEKECLWHVAKYYKMPIEKFLGDKYNIVQVFPKYKKCSLDSDKIEKYCKQQVLLYVPWRSIEELKGDKNLWQEVYDSHTTTIANNSGTSCSLNDVDADQEEYEEAVVNHRQNPEQWMTVSGMHPSANIDEVSLGSRDIDINYNWHASLQEYEQYGGIPELLTFLKRKKKEHLEVNGVNASTSCENHVLNSDQQRVIDLLLLQISHLSDCSNEVNRIPRTAIVQGKAGTGKSLIISRMADHVLTKFGPGSILLLGPTGVSALNINGSTIHSKLLINCYDDFKALNGQQLHNFQKKMENVHFVIVDEMSMVGCEMLHFIDQRLRQAKDQPMEEFGGLFVYLFGDVAQLPPVGHCPAYTDNAVTMEAISGKILYDNIDTAFILKKVHRQSDEVFLSVLNNIGSGIITKEDFDILETRFVTKEKNDLFDNDPHFYPTNLAKDNFNKKKLSGLIDATTNMHRPVARIPAKVSSKTKRFVVSESDGVEATLLLAKGSKIMLRNNLWTEMGLVNGSVGEIVDILYHPDASPHDDPPAVLICTFHSYKGPYLDESKKTIPIPPIQYNNEEGNEKHVYSQFPVCLNYGCTIHKSQGLTVERAFVDIGDRESKSGLTYVALSRVKSLSGLLLEPFTFLRFQRISKSPAVKLREKWLDQLEAKLY